MQVRLDRQQQAFHEAVVARDMQIQALRDALTRRVIGEQRTHATADEQALRHVIADLEKRLTVETRRRAAIETQLSAMTAALTQERAARQHADRAWRLAEAELRAIEQSFGTDPDRDDNGCPGLHGAVVLYVGGRPNQVAHLRAATERHGAILLHHDGGVEASSATLPGLASRADVVMFPVDCVSHEAVLAVKTVCRQAGKRFIPLRSASVTSLIAALGQLRTYQPVEAAE
jgi:hypothetical protein